MEKVLEKFKNLFKGEDSLKRHVMLLLLFILPAMAGSAAEIIDKEMPKEIMLSMLGIAAVLLLLSIIPLLFQLGFTVDFYKMRIKGKTGLPALDFEMLNKGLKTFPLVLIWGIYSLILFCIIFVAPLVCLAIPIFQSPSESSAFGPVILLVAALFVLSAVMYVVFMILAPFFNYMYFSFIEDMTYRAEYFNPFIIIGYMKSVFKETMITMLKFLLASIVINFALQIVLGVFMMIIFFVGMIAAAGSGDSDASICTPAVLVIILPISFICSLVQIYTTTMVGYAAGDAYMDIYKENIRIPDPLEMHEEEQEKPNNGGWTDSDI